MRVHYLLLACLIALPARAGFDEGMHALEREEYALAVAELGKSAMQGNLESSHQLGLMYLEGKGVKRDPALAREYFEEAAERWEIRANYKLGYPDAQYMLGRIYLEGMGVERDVRKAARWLERAAEQGHAEAQFALAELLLGDPGIGPDAAAAYFWLSIAADSLESAQAGQARAYLKELEGRLDPSLLRRIRRDVAAWEPEG